LKTGLSISVRITLWISAIFLLGFVAFGAAMWFDLEDTLLQGREKTLSDRARRASELLQSAGDETSDRLAARYRDFVDGTPEGWLVQIYDDGGRRILPADLTRPAGDFPWPAGSASDKESRTTVAWRCRPYRVFIRPAHLRRQDVRVFVAGQLEDNRLILEHFKKGLLRGFPIVLLISGVAGYFVSRRALNPVARLIDSGHSITIGNLSRRLPVSPRGDELARLAGTWNEMLERLELSVNCITRFTTDASHELRSPLSFIRVVSESMLRVPELDGESVQAFRDILAETQVATRLLDDMLMLARSDAGHIPIEFQPVVLEAVVAEAVGRLRALADEKRQALVTRYDAEGGAATSGDASLLRRLTWILIDNAVKYTPEGGRIDVVLTSSGDRTTLEVTDSGRGIPTEALPRIFERFYRVDPARSGEEGTGLGLAIAKWIADAHGAQIRAVSTEHVGTTFHLSFPPIEAS
jgi:heavy metal sensor kinase